MTSMALELGLEGRFSWGTHFADFDNDGDVDLFSATHGGLGAHFLYRNDGGLVFRDLGLEAIADMQDARGSAIGDIDRDGRLDLVIANRRAPISVLMNRTLDPGSFLRVRAPLGSWIELEAQGKKQVRQIVSGDGYRSSSEQVAHFGLGRGVKRVDRVSIRLPDGTTRELLDPAIDREY
jgi:hypothetical protein